MATQKRPKAARKAHHPEGVEEFEIPEIIESEEELEKLNEIFGVDDDIYFPSVKQRGDYDF